MRLLCPVIESCCLGHSKFLVVLRAQQSYQSVPETPGDEILTLPWQFGPLYVFIH